MRHCRILYSMYTIIETPTFTADAEELWSEDDRGKFCTFLAANPEAGSVIPRSGGRRKIRWIRSGASAGKSGGVRVIYFTRLPSGEIWLLTIYAKSERENIPAHILKAIREAIENDR